jgi:CheY-like chemotaxis protein
VSHTLLLADDSVTIQRVIELTFADEDVDVVAVSDGDEAIAILDRNPPDIVLADVGMPGRNGYEVAQHIKETPRLAHIPVVLLTGAFEPIDQAKAIAAGCDGVLAKPFEPQLVIGRVKELLSKPKQVMQGHAAGSPPWAAAPDVSSADAASGSGDAGDYFDRLDQAFANLAAGPDTSQSSASATSGATALDWFASQPPPAEGSPESGSTQASRWDVSTNPAPAPPLAVHFSPTPAPFSPPPPAFDTAQGAALDSPQGVPYSDAQGRSFDVAQGRPYDVAQGRPFDVAQGRPYDFAQGRPAPLPTLPPLADAFAALLAAEQAAPSPTAAPMWPTLPQPAATVTEDLVEKVTARVLDRLTDRVVQDAVAEKVSAVAERLVREEIERIKASIK